MRKNEFLSELKKYLYGLPEDEIRESLDYYAEIIDDRIEDGADEEAAVADVGKPWVIANAVRSEKLRTEKGERLGAAPEKATQKKQKRRMSAWVIVLLAVGSPIWLSLLIAAFAVVISVYAVLWSVVGVIWSTVAVFGAGALLGIFYLPYYAVLGEVWAGIALAGAGVLCGGLGVFSFIGCLSATKGMARLSKLLARLIKRCFVRRRVSE